MESFLNKNILIIDSYCLDIGSTLNCQNYLIYENKIIQVATTIKRKL